MLRSALPLLALAALAGCATTPPPAATAAPPSPAAGMEKLLGQAPDTALGLLGRPSLDRRDGPARLLQFAGVCVLDLYYYARAGSGAVATHAEARLPDGRPLPAGQCLGQLMQTRGG